MGRVGRLLPEPGFFGQSLRPDKEIAMSWRLRIALLLLVLSAVPFLLAPTPQNPTPPPDPDGGGCSYCSQEACGCGSQAGCRLYFNCACSALTCTRTCTFDCG